MEKQKKEIELKGQPERRRADTDISELKTLKEDKPLAVQLVITE